MRMTFAALGLLGVFATAPAHADWEYTKWGMTPEQVAQASQGKVKVIPKAERAKNDDIETAAEGAYVDGPLRMQVAFLFDANKLVSVMYAVDDAKQNGKLLDWLKLKFGPPQTGGGPNLGHTTYSWSNVDDVGFVQQEGAPAYVTQEPKN